MDPTPNDSTGLPIGDVSRRDFLQGSVASAALFAIGDTHRFAFLEAQQDAVLAQITAQHDATVKMMRDWIALPSIAAENLNYPQGPEYMAKLARDAGFDHVELITTAGKGGVFATLDSGAKNWLAVYMMYDVKQYPRT